MAGVSYNIPQTQYAGAWIGDELDRAHVLTGGGMLVAGDFAPVNAVAAVVGAAGAALGATSVPVAPLSGPIPSGAVLDFGGAKFARLTAPALQGATTLTVAALPTALVAGDSATYAPSGRKFVPSGTLVGRTVAERDAGRGFGPAAFDGAGNLTDDQVYLTIYDVWDANVDPSCSLYRRDSLVYEKYLPANSASGNALNAIRRLYECIKGVA